MSWVVLAAVCSLVFEGLVSLVVGEWGFGMVSEGLVSVWVVGECDFVG